MVSDDELYRAYLMGDASAGDAIMYRYGDLLVLYINGIIHDSQDAEDLMLDCISAILARRPKIGEGNFRAYLFRTARYMSLRHLQRKRRMPDFYPDENVLPGGQAPEEVLWIQDRNAALRRCLERIAPQYREALWLRYDLNMTGAETAEVLGCGKKRLENLLANGKTALRRELEKEGITREDI